MVGGGAEVGSGGGESDSGRGGVALIGDPGGGDTEGERETETEAMTHW